MTQQLKILSHREIMDMFDTGFQPKDMASLISSHEALRKQRDSLKEAMSEKLQEDNSFCMEFNAVVILKDEILELKKQLLGFEALKMRLAEETK